MCTAAHIPRSRGPRWRTICVAGSRGGTGAPHTPHPATELMTNFAFVFPGQGSQTVGMGRPLAAASPAAAAVFAQADEALGEPISNLAWEGPEDRLNRTENAQPALLATSIAYLVAAHERASAQGMTLPNPRFYAGHSM